MEATTSFTPRMLSTHPRRDAAGEEALARCIDACLACSQACVACADACLAEDRTENLLRCIRLNSDCADLCTATARVLSRRSEPEPGLTHEVLRACALACRLCADECERHAAMEHCRVCAEACRACQHACEQVSAGAPH